MDALHVRVAHLAVIGQILEAAVVDRIGRSGARIEGRQRLEIADVLAVDLGDRGLDGVGRRMLVEPLDRDADEAAVARQILGDVALDLIAAQDVVIDMVAAAAGAEIAADMIAQAVRQAAAVIAVDPRLADRQAFADADLAARLVAGLADIVDHRARRLAGEGRGRPAAHRLDALDIVVEAEPIIVVAEVHVAEQRDGQPVFLQRDIFRAAGRDRDTAHADVRIAAGAGGVLRLNAGDRAKHFGLRARGEIADRVLAQLRHRDRAAEPRAAGAGGGDDDVLAGVERSLGGSLIGRRVAARCGRRLGSSERIGGRGLRRRRRRHGHRTHRRAQIQGRLHRIILPLIPAR